MKKHFCIGNLQDTIRLTRGWAQITSLPPLHRYGSRFTSDYSPLRSALFAISREDALASLDSFHRSPITTTPRTTAVEQKYLSVYLIQATAVTRYRASIGRLMSMPYRDPQTGQIQQRQRLVWTTLPQVHEISSSYSPEEAKSQIYAGLEQYVEAVEPFLPIDPNLLRLHSTKTISEENFQMTLEYAKVKLKERIVAHTSQIAREMLSREYGANIKINEISVEINLQKTIRALYPVWKVIALQPSGSRAMTYLISGITARVSGLKLYDPMISGAAVGATTATIFLALFSSPFLSLLMLVASYLAASTFARLFPVIKLMRRESRRAADLLENQQYGGEAQESAGFAGFDPFGAFTGASGSRRSSAGAQYNPFEGFYPFAGAGGFNGQHRSSDPFYGYGNTGSGSYGQSQSRSRPEPPPQRAGDNLYKTLGVSKSATQDDITKAFRHLALTKHPDKVPAEKKAEASKEFAKINEAYRVLRNAGKRSQYDRYGVVQA